MEATLEVAKVAASVALRHFRSPLAVETKRDGSPVTMADREAERAARDWIERHFPRDGILGEEHGLTRESARRRWILDPIDGTKSFVRGVPLFGSLAAVVEEETVLAGAASYPALGETLCAAPGCGSWHDGARCSVSSVSALESALVLTSDERLYATREWSGWRRLVDAAGASRTWGDCYGYLLVATGRAEVMVDPVTNPWDAACFVPIIEEAGGVFTDWGDRHTAFGGSTIATNRALAVPARRLLTAAPDERAAVLHR
jgi:histidinol phosphatase-like enzyme (inositol monophosphatase family)